ncbi:TPA: hypothetical protein ACXDA9_001734 [Clostridium botulinum]|nr:hypothetical protein [Clostridium botulinum]EDT81184.1 arsenite methyltransferase [Clostridium botulinum NCTC 2916]MCS4447713.1 hypothetical protein [Clostridium botulinum]
MKNNNIMIIHQIGFPIDSQDVIISNCVINLSPNKQRVYGEQCHK